MSYEFDADAERRLDSYFSEIGDVLGDRRRRSSFAAYALGLLGTSERKSAEPLAAQAAGDEETCGAVHQQLLHVIGQSEWSDREVRRIAARHAVEAMTARRSGLVAWVIDDTGFPKQGKASVGVKRQYSGTLGKIGNCQVGVSLSVTTDQAHAPVDFELYLPPEWADDAAKRIKAKIPESVVFATKEQLALDMIGRAIEDEWPGDIVLADSWYGRSQRFRETIREYGLDYAVGIHSDQTIWPYVPGNKLAPAPMSVEAFAASLPASAFRRTKWRNGTRRSLASRFAFRRVLAQRERARGGWEDAETVWLIVEWPEDDEEPKTYALTTLPKRLSKKEIVRVFKERYRTERVYQDMKGELGLDHYEGRSYRGWNHHVTACICCFAFVIAERLRHFPPSPGRPSPSSENQRTPPVALRGFIRHSPPSHGEASHSLASALS
jgi:SRSO17 transposase